MIVSRLRLRNWRNFRSVDVRLAERVFIVGPNASGKSNQQAVIQRRGLSKVRCLAARREPDVEIEAFVSENGSAATWRYAVGITQQVRGYRQPVLRYERSGEETNCSSIGTQPLADECSRCIRSPDRIADGRLSSDERTLNRWFDPSAFVLATLDFSLFKNFRVRERKNLQFRWEMYNATNTPPFDPPGRGIGTGTFGRITSAGLGREMQFGLRLEF